MKKKNNTVIDLTILDQYPEALAKITEALGSVFFKNVLEPNVDLSDIHDAYTKAFRLCPNYRLILQQKRGFEKYKGLNKQFAQITSLPVL